MEKDLTEVANFLGTSSVKPFFQRYGKRFIGENSDSEDAALRETERWYKNQRVLEGKTELNSSSSPRSRMLMLAKTGRQSGLRKERVKKRFVGKKKT